MQKIEEAFEPADPQLLLTNDQHEKIWVDEIKSKVEYYLDKDPNLLFSYLYRLDIDETILHRLLHTSPPDELSNLLAIEIWKRQKQRIHAKKTYKPKSNLDYFDWE